MRQIEANTPLRSSIIDAMWDYKLGADIEGLQDNVRLRYWLAEQGFDVATWRAKQDKRERGRLKNAEREQRRATRASHIK